MTIRLTTIDDANALDQPAFVDALGWVFEHSPWVAARAWALRPFSSVEALHAAMIQQVEGATPGERLALLQAHPDLGTRARISAASIHEQEGAGLTQLTLEEFDRLHRLNSAYRSQFGFPFLFAVKGSAKRTIFESLEKRLTAPLDQEYDEALRQVYRIAKFRLDEIFLG